MSRMTDPSDALKSFQGALKAGAIQLQRGEIDAEIFAYLDHPNGTPRFTYVRIEGDTVTALVMFVMAEPLEGLPCFSIGYAVPEAYRNQGRVKGAIDSAIKEMKNGFSRAGISEFYIEAIIGAENEASQAVAVKTISPEPVPVTDQFSGLPAFQYVRKV